MTKRLTSGKAALIYLSPIPISSYAQRPHHFVEWFHKAFDADVLWLESSPIRFPQLADIGRLRAWFLRPFLRQLRSSALLSVPWRDAPWLEAKRLSGIPAEPSTLGRLINRRIRSAEMAHISNWAKQYEKCWLVIGRPCDAALDLVDRLPDCPFVLDVMDLVPAFYSGRSRVWVESAERQLVAKAKLVMVSSQVLHQRLNQFGAKLRLVRNGISQTLLEYLHVNPMPSRRVIKEKSTPKPLILGYIGAIAPWMDWGLLKRCLSVLTESLDLQIRVQLYGPIQAEVPVDLPSNISMMGPLAHDEIGRIYREFDLGLIPFKRTELTDAVDPIKYYEYRAAGLPVLSTRLAEMNHFASDPGLLFFDQLFTKPSLIQVLLDQRGEVRAGYADEVSWESRFHESIFML